MLFRSIVCILGLSANTTDRLVQLINAGMNVARLNMSHGDYVEHENRLNTVEILAVTGRSPSQHYADMESAFGTSYYARVDAEASRDQKAWLAALSPDDVRAHELAGQPITAVLTNAPGNGALIGGIKVTTDSGWFAARPSGTEDKYKIYAESLRDADHLAQIQAEAREVVDAALQG